MNFSQCNSADDQGGTLRTTVSAGIHQHGDEGYKKWNRSESVLISGNDGSCDGSREHEDQKPGNSMLCMCQYRCFKIAFFTWTHGSHFGNILGCLIYHNIHGIIECDDSDQPFVLIQNGEGEEIVFCKQLCHFFFVCMC